MHRRPNSELLPFGLEIEWTLNKLKKSKVENIRMVDHNSDRYSEGQSDHNDMMGMREPTLVDCWKLMLNENYSGIRYQSIDANNF